ncbi:hypothetical protein [Marinobacter fonticola]|uniref:hypothetical protein n=1 Tax=Marinobacter fonticola TaxID=2603215 RepID=UPI0011E81C4D|nr:hypothetical protein [Marinobacter fonticola]
MRYGSRFTLERETPYSGFSLFRYGFFSQALIDVVQPVLNGFNLLVQHRQIARTYFCQALPRPTKRSLN